ncbi:protein arginine methyltransferase 10 [Striga asiatica]|uniref:Protein arginine methyltransferase 10 n=1 Tax=Striga asiatica TaxID=4170 RepID=A0A5A7P774_STRAF|nr:protein arginine methyltransferase 10 [Striga asiatica]
MAILAYYLEKKQLESSSVPLARVLGLSLELSRFPFSTAAIIASPSGVGDQSAVDAPTGVSRYTVHHAARLHKPNRIHISLPPQPNWSRRRCSHSPFPVLAMPQAVHAPINDELNGCRRRSEGDGRRRLLPLDLPRPEFKSSLAVADIDLKLRAG